MPGGQIHGSWSTDGIGDGVALNMTKGAEDFFSGNVRVLGASGGRHVYPRRHTGLTRSYGAADAVLDPQDGESYPRAVLRGQNTNIRPPLHLISERPCSETKSRKHVPALVAYSLNSDTGATISVTGHADYYDPHGKRITSCKRPLYLTGVGASQSTENGPASCDVKSGTLARSGIRPRI